MPRNYSILNYEILSHNLSHVDFPHIPYVAHQVWTRFEGHFAGPPTRGGCLLAFGITHQLECLNLA